MLDLSLPDGYARMPEMIFAPKMLTMRNCFYKQMGIPDCIYKQIAMTGCFIIRSCCCSSHARVGAAGPAARTDHLPRVTQVKVRLYLVRWKLTVFYLTSLQDA